MKVAQELIIKVHEPLSSYEPLCHDLTPCDYFLWRYLKDKVHETPPINIDYLRIRITAEVSI